MNLAVILFFTISLVGTIGVAAEDYAIPVKPGDTSASIVENYLIGTHAWQEVKDYNSLLKPGNMVKVPSHLVNLKGKAVISLVYGEVKLKLAGEEKWIAVVPGLIIQEGDSLETGIDSGVEITMENGDRALLRGATTIIFNPPHDAVTPEITLLKVLRGKVISFIKQSPNRDLRYRIQTPTAVSMVRGTRFRTKVGDNAETIFEVLDGVVNIRSQGKELDLSGDFGVKI